MTNLITSTKNVSSTGDQKVDGLFSGAAWDGTITYAFPTTSTSYAYGDEKYYSFSSISSQQQSLALFFMEQSYGNAANDGFSVEGFTNANFEAGAADTATVRFAQSSLPPTAWAYTPNIGGRGGDVWFGTEYAGTEDDLRFPGFGNYAGHTVAHELGHALGLKHAQEAYASNTTVVPSAYDSLEYTIMTYHTFIGDDESGAKYEHDGAPQTFMMLDIAALQEMYGADYTTNSGDTVYKWNPNQGITYVNGVAAITPDANRIFATIWDGGGIDTYDLSAYTTALKIDLRAGGYSVFSQGQLADLGGGPNNGYARGNIFNALLYHDNVASLIENVQAGSGDDTIIGNEANNTLWGNAGNDTLSGGAGTDTLIGGTGNDTYIVDDLADVVTEGVNAGTDLIQTTLSSYALTNIANVENLTFSGTGAFSGTGNSLANNITGGAGNDTLQGGAGDDTLNGGAGNDTLIGGVGSDWMVGGNGNDLYVVDDNFDFVLEYANAGTDTVQTALSSYWLSGDVEILTYTGSSSFTGTGNALANTITGGAGNDVLNGGFGADSLIGGVGNDAYVVDNVGDVVVENAAEGTDTVWTNLSAYTLGANAENLTYFGTGAFTGTGNGLANTITGGAGNDVLNGGFGADSLIGGVGNDAYVVDNVGDVVVENAAEGTDTVWTNLSAYTLGANAENLTYFGTGAFTGTGNALVNIIVSGAGNDTLDGGAGADTLQGGAGNDIYVVDNAGDVVSEEANAGTDEIRTSLATYSIAAVANVENLTYTGSGAFTGTGNALANTITGGGGNDVLNGGFGADSLKGGAGDDTYVVDNGGDVVVENAAEGTDTVWTNLGAYTLGANVENLISFGTGAFTGTGNGLNNVLTGGAGIDTLKGGAGDDTYVISTGDVVVENAAEGTDTVWTNLGAYTLGANVENLTYIGTGAFVGTGNSLNNTIVGSLLTANTLDGGAGADTLQGGRANDVYYVDDAGDVVLENVGGGTDWIATALSAYALTSIANVEGLYFFGTGDFTGTGNALVNIIVSGAGNDTLDGGAGADTLQGGAGNDIYVVDNAGDVVSEEANAGTDEIRTSLATYSIAAVANVENLTYTGSGAFTGTGNALANTITGGGGNDVLNGGFGADSLKGGTGDDIYVVDIATDLVIENANEGTDTVQTALVSYTLGNNVENLTYTGSASFTGTGNALANTITGGAGNDLLNGGAGADTLIGGAGDDTYIVDNAADVVTENADAGSDTVRTTLASYTLGANVENLINIGTAAFAGTGNSLDNLIIGGSGTDTLTGGAGNDILVGGEAADFFVYSPNWGHDTIIDFLATGTAHDTIRIDHSIFADWASLLAASSQSGSDTIFTADIDNTITLKNVAVSSLQSADFQFA